MFGDPIGSTNCRGRRTVTAEHQLAHIGVFGVLEFERFSQKPISKYFLNFLFVSPSTHLQFQDNSPREGNQKALPLEEVRKGSSKIRHYKFHSIDLSLLRYRN